MTEYNLATLQSMVEWRDYPENFYPDFDTGIEYCRAALEAGEDCHFWETQLGYLYFIHFQGEHNIGYPTSIFETLVAKRPSDINARFWLGYISEIHFDSRDFCIDCMKSVLEHNPAHAYARLILSSYVDIGERIRLLENVIRLQKTNIRAYGELISARIENGERAEAKRMLEIVPTLIPFVERDYGIMNTYINDVITGATGHGKWVEEMQDLLKQLS